jgi:hypothetical protein
MAGPAKYSAQDARSGLQDQAAPAPKGSGKSLATKATAPVDRAADPTSTPSPKAAAAKGSFKKSAVSVVSIGSTSRPKANVTLVSSPSGKFPFITSPVLPADASSKTPDL